MDVIGGRAHFHGVSFSGKIVNVRAYRNDNGEIKTEMASKSLRRIIWVDHLYAVPFLRGILFYLDVVVSMWRLMLIFLISSFIILTGLSYSMPEEAYGQTLDGINILLTVAKCLVILWFMVLFKRSRMAAYHGAEHKVFHAYRKNIDLTINNVRQENRVSFNCGTNFVVFFASIYGFLLLFPMEPWLRLACGSAVGYELFLLPWQDNRHWLHYILYPFYTVGLALQRYVLTSEPSDDEIETAIVAMTKLRSLS